MFGLTRSGNILSTILYVFGESFGMVRSFSSQASVRRMPSPPPFVIIPMRLPCAGGWPETARAMSNNSIISRQRIPPACLIAASYILSLPAMDPV